MNLSKRSLIIALIVILISTSSITYFCMKNHKATAKPKVSVLSHSDQLSQKEKLADFEYMYTVLKENYPFFEVNKRMNNVDWLNKKSEYIKEIKATNNDQEFYTSLNSIVKELNNRHTNILDKKGYVYFYNNVFSGSASINKPWYTELSKKKTQSRYLVKWNNALYDKNTNNLSVSNAANTDESSNIHTQILIKNKVAYLSISSFDTNIINTDEDMRTLKPFLSRLKNYDALIIDIRGNSGGNNAYWQNYLVPLIINKPLTNREYYVYRGGDFSASFIKCALGDAYNEIDLVKNINKEDLKNIPPEITKDFKYYLACDNVITPKDSVGFKGKVFMLVDKDVYSASEMFATFAKHTGFATIVGEKTGGDGIGQTPLLCSLPNSGYVLKFSYVMGLTSDGSCDEEVKTEPDIKVNDATKAANLNNDKTVQTVLKLLK